MKRICIFLSLTALVPILNGCIQTKHEVDVKPIEVKPMHITIDLNIKIQEELKEKFAKSDKIAEEISDEEAARALDQYLSETGKEQQ